MRHQTRQNRPRQGPHREAPEDRALRGNGPHAQRPHRQGRPETARLHGCDEARTPDARRATQGRLAGALLDLLVRRRTIMRAALAGLGLALVGATMLFAQAGPGDPPRFWLNEWPKTDFSITSVHDWGEIRGGGPPRDGIPAIDAPRMIAVAQQKGIEDREAVVTVKIEGQPARAYPLRYLIWHEIVNDEAGNQAYAVTYCPLCNSVPVFDRKVKGQVLSFGVTGKLRNSNLIMYDRQSESWWQQATGEAIVGKMTGTQLVQIPSWQESFAEFAAREKDGLIMAEPDWSRRYGTNPYAGYDSARQPFLYSGDPPPHDIPPLARVLRVGNRAWPLERLRKAGELREGGLIITWRAGQASALDDRRISRGRDVGTIRVRDERGRDVPHDIMFAFAFNAFWPEPDGVWMLGN